ncbi:MAG TPA: DMT family transporter, partial [Candidatus Saccharimonadales bacterium]|nr:DMT family transporter [Candidatus Saccharimonadales bacterium]
MIPAEAGSKSRLAEGALVLITIIWGTTFPLLRTSLRILDPYDIVALRFTIAAVLIAAITWKRFRYLNRTALWDGALTGFFMGTGYLVQAIGLTTISSPRSAFITGTAVIFVPFIDRFVSRLGATRGEIVAVALTFLGLLLFYADANL